LVARTADRATWAVGRNTLLFRACQRLQNFEVIDQNAVDLVGETHSRPPAVPPISSGLEFKTSSWIWVLGVVAGLLVLGSFANSKAPNTVDTRQSSSCADIGE